MKKIIYLFVVLLIVVNFGSCDMSSSEVIEENHTNQSEIQTDITQVDSLYGILSGENIILSEALVEHFYNYYESHSKELRFLPTFDGESPIDWDSLTLFVRLNTQTETDAQEIPYITEDSFNETVSRFFGQLSYTAQDSSFSTYSDGRYILTGMSYGGAVYYKLRSIERSEDDVFTASFDGISFNETDFFSAYDEASENMKAVMDANNINTTSDILLVGILKEYIHNTIMSENYKQLFKIDETVTIQFTLSDNEDYPIVYLSCTR